jgi:hypothetical protein
MSTSSDTRLDEMVVRNNALLFRVFHVLAPSHAVIALYTSLEGIPA